MNRARRDGALVAGVVVGGAHGHGPVAVAVGGLKDGVGDVRPGPDRARAGAAVGAVGRVRPQHAEDSLHHVAREGQTAKLVIHNFDLRKAVLRVGDAVGQPLHRLDDVVSLADGSGAGASLGGLGSIHRGAIFG